MALNQFFRLIALILLSSCSNETNKSDIDYQEEFNSITFAFENSSILDFNAQQDIDGEFLSDFINKLDPQKSIFLESDISQFQSKELTNTYDVLNNVVEVFYDRYSLSLELRKDLLMKYKFNFDLDESISFNKDKGFMSKKDEIEDYERKIIKNELIVKMLNGDNFEEARKELLNNYKDRISSLKKIRASDKFGVLANNFLSLLDPHSSYFSQRDIENWNLRMNLSFEGIGAILGYENEKAKIEELMPGGPAINSKKINVGDRIISVGQGSDGVMENVIGWRLDDIVDSIRGDEGTIVKLEVETDSTTKIIELERGKVSLEESDASKEVIEMDNYEIGYIKLPSFYSDIECLRISQYGCKSATQDIKRFLIDFKLSGVDGVILDLRNNGGGFLHEADSLTRLFIDSGPTVQVKSPERELEIYTTWQTTRTWNKPLIVLVNKFSASASEIFAGAMQDYNRALVVGQTTFGKGSVQRFKNTINGQIKLTDSLYYRVTGEPTQLAGVEPHLELPSLLESDGAGEDRYDNAIKPSQIDQALFFAKPTLPLNSFSATHSQRIAQSLYYQKISEIKMSNEKDEVLSLNLNSRQSRQNEDRLKTLELINLNRKISGLDQLETYEDYLNLDEDYDFVLDAEIDQSLNIIEDLIRVTS